MPHATSAGNSRSCTGGSARYRCSCHFWIHEPWRRFRSRPAAKTDRSRRGRTASASSRAWIEVPGRWDVHLIPYSHHDYGYTDLPSVVFAQHRDYLDRAMRLCRDTEQFDERAQYCFSIEESSSLVSWLEGATETGRNELAGLATTGRIEITALYVNAMTSLCSTEVMIRHLYPAASASTTLQSRVTVAVQNDVPGLPWGLMSLLGDIGVDSLVFGTPSWYFGGRCSANGEQWGAQRWIWDENRVMKRDQPGELTWEGPDGQTVRVYRNFHGGDEELYVWSLTQLEADLSREARTRSTADRRESRSPASRSGCHRRQRTTPGPRFRDRSRLE